MKRATGCGLEWALSMIVGRVKLSHKGLQWGLDGDIEKGLVQGGGGGGGLEPPEGGGGAGNGLQ